MISIGPLFGGSKPRDNSVEVHQADRLIHSIGPGIYLSICFTLPTPRHFLFPRLATFFKEP
nr:hypothetical protein Q903MT_gene4960 [Picea sitchensis]